MGISRCGEIPNRSGQAFRQQIHADGQLVVSVDGEAEVLRATWYISDGGEYCERWPDHESCFRIGLADGNRLIVESDSEADIESWLHPGMIELDFREER